MNSARANRASFSKCMRAKRARRILYFEICARIYIYRRANLYYSSESGAWRCRSGLSRILFASSSFFCYKMPRWADLKNLHSVRFNINIYTLCIFVYWLIDNSSFAFIKRFYVTVKCSDGDDVKFAYAYIYSWMNVNYATNSKQNYEE